MLEIAQTIGADVAFFLQQSPAALAWGRGDRLLSLPAVAPHPVVIAIADARISTGAAYREASTRLNLPAKPAVLEGLGAAEPGIAGLLPPPPLRGNDFEPTVFEEWPHLAEIRDALAEMGALEARLTGSGSAIFGIFAAPGGRRAGCAPDCPPVRSACRSAELYPGHPSAGGHSPGSVTPSLLPAFGKTGQSGRNPHRSHIARTY